METLLNDREAAVFLDISREELKELAVRKVIPAYMIAGVFLRFKKSELEAIRDMARSGAPPAQEERVFTQAFSRASGLERVKEILRANDIYILIGGAIIFVLALFWFR